LTGFDTVRDTVVVGRSRRFSVTGPGASPAAVARLRARVLPVSLGAIDFPVRILRSVSLDSLVLPPTDEEEAQSPMAPFEDRFTFRYKTENIKIC